jgi:thiamine biosynthesis lipoprotein
VAVLVNFGGDIAANKPPQNKPFWGVGIEDKGHAKKAKGIVQFKQGGIATSGDAKRFLLKGKKRYGHILNPKTGWPIAAAPNAITVLANSCVEAGILSTLAMLQGKNAEKFLQAEGVQYRVQR